MTIARYELNRRPVQVAADQTYNPESTNAVSGVAVAQALAASAGAVSITYAALVALRNGGNLVAGRWYRITDYACSTTQENTQSAGHAYDIIVLAIDGSHLNEAAFAAHHTGDTYFQNSKLEAWELKYCLDNDTNRFAWADGTNGKGVVYWMKDEWNNECSYDFKNILFVRHEKDLQNMVFGENWLKTEDDAIASARAKTARDNVDNASFKSALYAKFGYEDIHTASDYSSLLDFESVQYEDDDEYVPIAYDEDWEATIIAKVLANTQACYTFSTDLFADASLNGKTNNVRDNKIGANYENNVMKLNNNVFFGTNIYSNSIEEYSYNNSCGAGFACNSIGAYFRYNSIGAYFQYNSCGANCYCNSIGAYFDSNSIGAYFYYNSIGAYFYYNSIGAYCYNNSIGANCYNNSIGAGFACNSIGANCYNNSIGAYFQYSTIFDNVQYCSILGGTNASPIKNTQILNGTAGEDGDLLEIEFEDGVSYMQCAGINSSDVLKIWAPADQIGT